MKSLYYFLAYLILLIITSFLEQKPSETKYEYSWETQEDSPPNKLSILSEK